MRTKHRYLWLFLAAAALGAGCGGGGGSDAENATVHGTLSERAADRAASGPVTVLAVDDTGEAVAVTQTSATFVLSVPTGHDYVLILSDSRGVIGAMLHGAPGAERPDFAVSEGTEFVDAGPLIVDRSSRLVRASPGARLPAASRVRGADTDGDGIPDRLDSDDDNDGIPDALDWSPNGRDRSLDHDNDGIADATDDDVDNDGIADDDVHPRDFDNDGQDDDRDADDDESDLHHPRTPDSMQGDSHTGKAVFLTRGCADCHGPEGHGGSGAPEPIRGASPREVAAVLAHGEGDDPDEAMPAYPDLVPSAADVAAFLDGALAPAAAPSPTPVPKPAPAPTPAPGVDGQTVYDGSCRGCHRLGSLDTLGSAPDLSGKGANVRTRFSAAVAGHKAITLSAGQVRALVGFVNAN